jgi:uncharacterized protein YggE
MAAEVVVQGAGSVEVAPDAARLAVSARGRAGTSAEAHAAASAIATAVDALLVDHADSIRRRSTSGLVVSPAHEWRDGNRHFVGWDALRTTTIEVVDVEAIGPLFAGFADAGAVAGSIEWVVDPDNVGHTQARRAAAVDARARAAAYADALGVTLGPVLDVREPATKDPGLPEPRMYAMASAPMADAAMDVEAPQLRVEAAVDVTFGLVNP